jgi:hypothetical protein
LVGDARLLSPTARALKASAQGEFAFTG